jgi:hypothetical protein
LGRREYFITVNLGPVGVNTEALLDNKQTFPIPSMINPPALHKNPVLPKLEAHCTDLPTNKMLYLCQKRKRNRKEKDRKIKR